MAAKRNEIDVGSDAACLRKRLVVRHSGFDGLIPSQLRIGKFSGGTRISMLLGAPA